MSRIGTRNHDIDIAAAALLIALLSGLASPSRTLAATPGASPVSPAQERSSPSDSLGLGSSGKPIPVPGTAIGAPRRLLGHEQDRIGLRAGSMRAWVYGITGTTPNDSRAAYEADEETSAPEFNDFAGARIGVAIDRRSDVYLEGGRMALRDPIDVLAWGRDLGAYWTTSAGLGIHF